jgi:hypothetical protein
MLFLQGMWALLQGMNVFEKVLELECASRPIVATRFKTNHVSR